MKRSVQFALILTVATLSVAVASHVLVRWLGLVVSPVKYRLIGPKNSSHPIFAAGSSLMLFGLSWPTICAKLDRPIENWGVPASSPAEWEPFQATAGKENLTFITVSAYDLNENLLCDFRADIVPLTQSAHDLWESGATWEFSKRVLSCYPLSWVRYLYPTAGRSQGVLTGLRAKLYSALHGSAPDPDDDRIAMSPDEGPRKPRKKEGLGDLFSDSSTGAKEMPEEIEDIPEKTIKVSDMPQARVLRRFALQTADWQGDRLYQGPKKLAFIRMIHAAQRHGRTIVIVMPVAPLYAHEFLSKAVVRQFENSLSDVQKTAPGVPFIRLDQIAGLKSNDLFLDFVHLNTFGKKIATAELLSNLKQEGLTQ